MSSLQLLQLTEHGRSFVASRRKTILVATGILAAGGTAAYVQSRFSYRKLNSFSHSNGLNDAKQKSEKVPSVKKTKRKKGGLKSLQVFAGVLLFEMGKMGMKDLLALLAMVVLRTALGNRLAKVEGFLFRAAFLRRVPLIFLLILENIILCFLLSAMHSTSNYITGTLSLRFRKILTRLIHAHYF